MNVPPAGARLHFADYLRGAAMLSVGRWLNGPRRRRGGTEANVPAVL